MSRGIFSGFAAAPASSAQRFLHRTPQASQEPQSPPVPHAETFSAPSQPLQNVLCTNLNALFRYSQECLPFRLCLLFPLRRLATLSLSLSFRAGHPPAGGIRKSANRRAHNRSHTLHAAVVSVRNRVESRFPADNNGTVPLRRPLQAFSHRRAPNPIAPGRPPLPRKKQSAPCLSMETDQ